MQKAATRFLTSLYDAQRLGAKYDFTDPERYRWQYTPGPRGGIRRADLDNAQREAAMGLLDASLSTEGARTARAIMDLEPVLRALEEEQGRPGSERRNQDDYWFSVFGDPTADQPWAWRVGGHHLCLHFTVVGDSATVTPLFFGANPARVPVGEHEGLRVLGPEEDLARDLVACLDEGQRARAIVSAEAPSDILTGNAVRAEIAAVPTGLSHRDLTAPQQEVFGRLVARYLDRVQEPPPLAPDKLTFAWAGSTEPGQGHYYAIRGDSFLVEYDNTQNNANHVHTAWRDLQRDWGDLLADHYRQSH